MALYLDIITCREKDGIGGNAQVLGLLLRWMLCGACYLRQPLSLSTAAVSYVSDSLK